MARSLSLRSAIVPRSLGLLVLAGALWITNGIIAHRAPATSQPSSTPGATSRPAFIPNATTDSSRWDGELLLVRDGALVARSGDGRERTVYQPEPGQRIRQVTAPANGAVWVELTGESSVMSVDVKTGETTPLELSSLGVRVPQPEQRGAYALSSFSNAERDFGSAVTLVNGSSVTSLVHPSVAVTSLAWRSDGAVLAVGAQRDLMFVSVAGGELTTVQLTDPIVDLHWRGNEIIVETTTGVAAVSQTTQQVTHVPITRPVRNVIPLGDQRYVWLVGSSVTEASDLVYDTIGTPSIVLGSATHLIGIMP